MKPKSDSEMQNHLAARGSSGEDAGPDGRPVESATQGRRHEDFAAVWRAIGPGEITPPPRDLWPAIAEHLQQTRPSPARRLGVWAELPRFARIAATLLLAVTLGHLVGRGYLATQDAGVAPTMVAGANTTSDTEADMEAKVCEEAHLDALGSPSILRFVMSVFVNNENPKEDDNETGET